MFALTGKLFEWNTRDVNGKNIVNIIVYKKSKDKEYKYSFYTFSQRVYELLQQKLISDGDSVEIKFYIKCREYNSRWYTDLYADEMLLLKKGRASSINMFEGKSKSF